MTSLAVSLSVDARGPSALYILTDSRISWKTPENRWDGGQKTFYSSRFADVFAYCGDAYFPPMMLRQVVELLDAGLLCPADASAELRHETFFTAMRHAMTRITGSPAKIDFSIYHGARDGVGMCSKFLLWEIRHTHSTNKWTDSPVDLDSRHSNFALLGGTGRSSIELEKAKWIGTSARDTSRAGVWAFFASLKATRDKFSGGSPQIVGMWRIGAGRRFGIVWKDSPYVAGLRAVGDLSNREFKWFDEDFEPCDYAGVRLKPNKAHTRFLK